MKFPNLKKYFFSHIAVLLTYVCLYLIIKLVNTKFPEAKPDDLLPPYTSQSLFILLIAAFITLAILITIVEILFRKFVIEKYFPNFKLKFEFKIPKFICVIHSIIFYFGFFLASVIALFISLCMIIHELEHFWL